MNWYKTEGDAWKAIIETVAAETHRNVQMVEKDTVQSIILQKISKSELPIVFKGGTSLSKAYGLIDRFSEDIDLSMNRRPTESEKRKINAQIIGLVEELGLVLTNPAEIQSRHSYNKYVFEYKSLFSDIPSELIVETSFFQAAYPAEMHPVYSFIGRFCSEKNIILPIHFEAATVEMQVQSLERTFVDKVFAVCDYRIQNMQDRDSRHLYDIAKLIPEIQLNQELKTLAAAVRKDRMLSKNNPSAQPEYSIPDMLKEIISSRFYESDYNNITNKLLYENVPYEYAIRNGIAIVAETEIFL